jgi:hypothetical protein
VYLPSTTPDHHSVDPCEARSIARVRSLYSTTWSTGADEFGQSRPSELRDWAAWDERFGWCERRSTCAVPFDTTLVERPRTG